MSCFKGWAVVLVVGALASCAPAAGGVSSPEETKTPPAKGAEPGEPTPPPEVGAPPVIAKDLPEHCKGEEILRVDREVATGRPELGRFSYGFRFKAPAIPGAPVLVYLPGGPGMTSTEDPPLMLPLGWGYLLTDPRGTGCNTLASIPSADVSAAFFRTPEIAKDVVAAIRDRKLDAYVVFGNSYGTALGTHVAHELETQNVPPPRGVVLEGVLGRAHGANYPGAEFINQWDLVRAELPRDVAAELEKASPYDIPASRWLEVLPLSLYIGRTPVVAALSLLSKWNPFDSVRDTVLDQLRSFAPPAIVAGEGAQVLARNVICREFTTTMSLQGSGLQFVQGRFVRDTTVEGTLCGDIKVTDPYDSAKLQFAAKTYYFLGEADPATPVWQGDYHFDHHEGRSVRVVSLRGGHFAFQLDHAPCASPLLRSIANGGDDFSTLVKLCPGSVAITEK